MNVRVPLSRNSVNAKRIFITRIIFFLRILIYADRCIYGLSVKLDDLVNLVSRFRDSFMDRGIYGKKRGSKDLNREILLPWRNHGV